MYLNLEESKVTRRNLFLCTIVSGIACMALATAASATVPRAFVSTQGLDTNPCSAVQPCRSFNQALAVVQPGGEIVVQDSGGYSTGFTITQSVTIDAGGFNASVLSTGHTDLCSISAGPTDRVVLRGISFHGAGVANSGVFVSQVGSLYLEHCSFEAFPGPAVGNLAGGNMFVTDNDFRKCAVGLSLGAFSAASINLVLEDSRFSDTLTSAVSLQNHGTGAVTGLVTNCTASQGEVGFELDSIGAGNADMTLTNCRATGNSQEGLLVTAQSTGNATMKIANSTVTQNVAGILTSALSTGTATVIGTGPGTNLISGNASGNAVGSTATLQ
jgi:hypothetical protein